MKFEGFTEEDFKVFDIAGLEERMGGIRERIQPKFAAIGERLAADVALLAGEEMFVHIAKHARRKVNPPVDTWMAFGPNKRGYKQYPHFQIGLFDDRVFIWLAYIYEVKDKSDIADRLIKNIPRIQSLLPTEALVSYDHMRKDAVPANQLNETAWKESLLKFKTIKNAEIMIGTQIGKDAPILRDGEQFLKQAMAWLEPLAFIYKIALPR